MRLCVIFFQIKGSNNSTSYSGKTKNMPCLQIHRIFTIPIFVWFSTYSLSCFNFYFFSFFILWNLSGIHNPQKYYGGIFILKVNFIIWINPCSNQEAKTRNSSNLLPMKIMYKNFTLFV